MNSKPCMLARMRSKGKVTLTAEETAEEDAVFLADCTKSFHYIERDGLEGRSPVQSRLRGQDHRLHW